ncbi:hypothetical protein A1332_11135 [Methylomonas methanica]|uniref:Uncharacterized protein n=1 Tax=Methylomonas methanica TaxID=421 RepID=A0A177MLS9_METMH|nr:hypothetical protein A1332_11135 [Methylomonas methanica]
MFFRKFVFAQERQITNFLLSRKMNRSPKIVAVNVAKIFAAYRCIAAMIAMLSKQEAIKKTDFLTK